MNSPLTPPKQKSKDYFSEERHSSKNLGINFINIEKLLSPSSQRTHETEETSSSSPKNNYIKSEGFFEKVTEERPSSWTKVPTKDTDFCQIKHQYIWMKMVDENILIRSFVNIEFQIIVNARPQDCVCYFTEKLFWMSNVFLKNNNVLRLTFCHRTLKSVIKNVKTGIITRNMSGLKLRKHQTWNMFLLFLKFNVMK